MTFDSSDGIFPWGCGLLQIHHAFKIKERQVNLTDGLSYVEKTDLILPHMNMNICGGASFWLTLVLFWFFYIVSVATQRL